MTATKVSSTESWHSEVKQTGLPFPYYLIQKKEWDMCFIKSQKTLLKTCKVKKKTYFTHVTDDLCKDQRGEHLAQHYTNGRWILYPRLHDSFQVRIQQNVGTEGYGKKIVN
jgi:hypothetical protein